MSKGNISFSRTVFDSSISGQPGESHQVRLAAVNSRPRSSRGGHHGSPQVVTLRDLEQKLRSKVSIVNMITVHDLSWNIIIIIVIQNNLPKIFKMYLDL